MPLEKLGFLTRTYVFVQRLRQILLVLLKYGFEDLVSSLGVDQHLKFGWRLLSRRYREKNLNLSREARIKLVLEELGPTFVKMGQTLAARTDLLPAELVTELVKLQDHVSPFPSAVAKEIVESELGAPCDDLFLEFVDEPLAAGSIGQVHKALLKSGEWVAVKVQRPDIRTMVHVDLEIIHYLAGLMERHLDLGQVHRPTKVADEFARILRQELDYTIEAANIERFTDMLGDNPNVYIHKLYQELTTPRVIITELVDGLKPENVDKMRGLGYDPAIIARRGAELLMTQVFFHGFFHADPHPGNIFVVKGNRVCFIDFGMMGRLDRQSREIFADLVLNVIAKDETKATDALLRLTHGHALADRLSLEREISELIDHNIYKPLKDLAVGVLIRDLLNLTAKYDLRIPAQYFLLIKSISQIENLGRALDPDFSFTEQSEPYIRKLLINRYHPKRILRDFYETGSDLAYLLKEVPGELRELLKQAKRGKVKIELRHIGLRPFFRTLESVSNRITSAIVLASLIVGSSLIVLSKVPPLWHEIPVIGLGGYLASGVMGLLLLRSVSRKQ